MMRAQIRKRWNDLRSSYWFIPATMVVVALLLSLLALWIDDQFENELPDWLSSVGSEQPDGARGVLSTLAGSMITVAGLTFSMTLLAVSHASTQFGPRLLTNFMRNRGNQFVLGAYVATFVYCLMVLQAVRDADSDSSPPVLAFVPKVSLAISLVLAVANVGVLIYYIHHVAESLRLSRIVATVGQSLHGSVNELFPQAVHQPDAKQISQSDECSQQLLESLKRQPHVTVVSHPGFLQTLDLEGLVSFAQENHLVIELLHRPGDFIAKDAPLLKAAPADRLNNETIEKLGRFHATGIHRTPEQNSLFLADQLAEVAIRAVSPGINDPHTAIDCFHWLTSFLHQLNDFSNPAPHLFDEDGVVRLVARPVTYEDFCDIIFDQVRPYITRDINVMKAVLRDLNWLITNENNASRQALLRSHANRLLDAAEESGCPQSDYESACELRPT